MVSVTVRDVAYEDGGDDERAGHADDPDYIVKNAIFAPGFEGFFYGFGEAKVCNTGEILVDPVVISCTEEFLGTHCSELIPVVGGHDVLSAFASVEREKRCVGALTTGLVGEHAAVFIVWVSDDHRKAGASVKLLQRLREGCRAAVYREWTSEGRLIFWNFWLLSRSE